MQARHEFLEHLHPDTQEYKYLGFSSLLEAVSKEYDRFIVRSCSPYVIITDIGPDEVDDHEESIPGRADYSPSLQLLILSMVSLPHEEAAGVFDRLVGTKATQMMIHRILSIRGRTHTKTSEREKQADCSYGPRHLPPGGSTQWPTLALEVAFPESREKVKKDVAWWLNRSAGDVLRAISIDIKRPSGNIYTTLWKRGMATNQCPNPDPEALQEIKIYRAKMVNHQVSPEET
ncbi:hypothetical protein AJ80_03003 [Polytolypa hystricis UAMH7299]|uniref:Uncharacterized protein n=1 Tax=Polytolypa hystricis (strain UAMH7299) TaxID=1447883 RepID=A0A2B7YFV1_POLH7|nr:hypothetical protein AJ80_03003 [Polytolypa hystricis UAMH7299]